MTVSSLRYGLCAGTAAALLAACALPLSLSKGQDETPLPISSFATASHRAATNRQVFQYTGKPQTFKVPTNVTQITVVARGAGSPSGKYYTGSRGGLVSAAIPVTPGETLTVFVGGAGFAGANGAGGMGGFNGGAAGGQGAYSTGFGNNGNGGGGGSDVRRGGSKVVNRVVVAGGGGGGGGGTYYSFGGAGGAGGGDVGAPGQFQPGHRCHGGFYYPDAQGGTGGTQSVGGRGGRGGSSASYGCAPSGRRGKLRFGGAGAGGGQGGGGGGGGGYFGGGGGGAGNSYSSGPGAGGGGGGGSSYVEPSATHVKNIQGEGEFGNGKVVISW